MIRDKPDLGWLHERTVGRVIAALTAAGATARFVGGCVRDNLVGLPVTDIDIAIDVDPNTVTALLEQAKIKAVPTGIDHGTVTAVAGHRPFEITTLRRDVETYGRHAAVAFTEDWHEDAARRDFTINALYRDPDGTLFDPMHGKPDLADGRIRFVGVARDRIEEDRLRVLRFFRFYARYGAPPADPEAIEACKEAADRLDLLSAERVQKELLKLFGAHDPIPALRLMRDCGVLEAVLPEFVGLEVLEGLLEIENSRREADPALRLAAVLPRKAETVAAVALRLKFPNALRDRLAQTASVRLDSAHAAKTVYRLGPRLAHDTALLAGARGEPGWERVLIASDAWAPLHFPLAGADVLSLGVEAGPEVGVYLRRVEDWWVEGGFKADRAACLRELGKVVKSGTG